MIVVLAETNIPAAEIDGRSKRQNEKGGTRSDAG
jgi:hypothetical protein